MLQPAMHAAKDFLSFLVPWPNLWVESRLITCERPIFGLSTARTGSLCGPASGQTPIFSRAAHQAQRGQHAFDSKPQPQPWHSKRSQERQVDCAQCRRSPLAASYGCALWLCVAFMAMPGRRNALHGDDGDVRYENARYRRSLRRTSAAALRTARSCVSFRCQVSRAQIRQFANLSPLWRRRSSASSTCTCC
jgi:hypothetical protein